MVNSGFGMSLGYSTAQHNTKQHNTTQHNTTQQNTFSLLEPFLFKAQTHKHGIKQKKLKGFDHMEFL